MTRWAASAIAVALLALSGCGESYSYRYRLSLHVDDNGELLSGSNVVEMQTSIYSGLASIGSAGPQVQTSAHGEALIIRLKNGKLLVAGLRALDWKAEGSKSPRLWFEDSPLAVLQVAYEIAPPHASTTTGDWLDDYRATLRDIQSQSGPREILFDHLPDLLTFSEPSNPASVAVVNPHDLSSSLGNGVRLIKATIEVTGDDLSYGIEKQLPWVATIDGRVFSGKFATDTSEPKDVIHRMWLRR